MAKLATFLVLLALVALATGATTVKRQAPPPDAQVTPGAKYFTSGLFNISAQLFRPWVQFSDRLSKTASTLPDLFAAKGARQAVATPIHITAHIFNSIARMIHPKLVPTESIQIDPRTANSSIPQPISPLADVAITSLVQNTARLAKRIQHLGAEMKKAGKGLSLVGHNMMEYSKRAQRLAAAGQRKAKVPEIVHKQNVTSGTVVPVSSTTEEPETQTDASEDNNLVAREESVPESNPTTSAPLIPESNEPESTDFTPESQTVLPLNETSADLPQTTSAPFVLISETQTEVVASEETHEQVATSVPEIVEVATLVGKVEETSSEPVPESSPPAAILNTNESLFAVAQNEIEIFHTTVAPSVPSEIFEAQTEVAQSEEPRTVVPEIEPTTQTIAEEPKAVESVPESNPTPQTTVASVPETVAIDQKPEEAQTVAPEATTAQSRLIVNQEEAQESLNTESSPIPSVTTMEILESMVIQNSHNQSTLATRSEAEETTKASVVIEVVSQVQEEVSEATTLASIVSEETVVPEETKTEMIQEKNPVTQAAVQEVQSTSVPESATLESSESALERVAPDTSETVFVPVTTQTSIQEPVTSQTLIQKSEVSSEQSPLAQTVAEDPVTAQSTIQEQPSVVEQIVPEAIQNLTKPVTTVTEVSQIQEQTTVASESLTLDQSSEIDPVTTQASIQELAAPVSQPIVPPVQNQTVNASVEPVTATEASQFQEQITDQTVEVETGVPNFL